jgi:hypothetical protein
MTMFSTIGSGILYLIAYCVFVGATTLLAGALASTLADLSLKGKPDANMDGVGGFISGLIIGGIISVLLIGYFIFTMTLYSTFMTTLGICACLAGASLFVVFLNQRLYGR